MLAVEHVEYTHEKNPRHKSREDNSTSKLCYEEYEEDEEEEEEENKKNRNVLFPTTTSSTQIKYVHKVYIMYCTNLEKE